MPHRVPYAVGMLFFKTKRSWILDTMARQKERQNGQPSVSDREIESMRRQAKAQLPARLAALAKRHGFTYNKVTIKHNATNWGSCSNKGNINLNLNIVRLPKVLQDYVLLHELCHLRHHDHGHAFHLLLEHMLTDNLMIYMDNIDGELPSEDVILASDLARKAASSKARYPLDHTFSHAVKGYALI